MLTLNFDYVVESLNSSEPVRGYTHNFYRYPARFSPQFARAVISQFSRPDDYIIDPFMGGGTSIVEAVPMGRCAIGIDLNPLAHFIARVKTTPLTIRDANQIRSWVAEPWIKGACSPEASEHIANLPLRLKRLFECYLCHLTQLPQPRQQRLVRTALLKTGQWALDCRTDIPTKQQVANRLQLVIDEMLESLNQWTRACHENGISFRAISRRRKLLCCSAASASDKVALECADQQPRLVITSPPYPGVHVLYHRWQVQGRRETPAPYWLSGLNDGNGAAYYTLGSRSKSGIEQYFRSVTESFRSVKAILHPNARVVQLVAFSDTGSQLTRYLQAMSDAGYTELDVYSGERNSRVWRRVPNRKWYAGVYGDSDSMKEVLFVHRPSK